MKWLDTLLIHLTEPSSIHNKPGGVYDALTYMGHIRFFVVCAVLTFVLWHLSEPLCSSCTQRHIEWLQLLAWIIGGTGMASSLFSMVYVAYLRHRMRESRQGQWYERDDLTQAELYEDEPFGVDYASRRENRGWQRKQQQPTPGTCADGERHRQTLRTGDQPEE
jgi:hypothetical protein